MPIADDDFISSARNDLHSSPQERVRLSLMSVAGKEKYSFAGEKTVFACICGPESGTYLFIPSVVSGCKKFFKKNLKSGEKRLTTANQWNTIWADLAVDIKEC